MRRGRSPARSTFNTSPTKSSLSRGTTGTARVTPKGPRHQEPRAPERDQGFRKPTREVRIRNTPEHLYGIDNADDSYDDDALKKNLDLSQESKELSGCSKVNEKWYQMSWVKVTLMAVIVVMLIQAFLFLKGREIKLDNLDLSSDASICLRSHEELRKKLALAFELINESGKLFKQLERQTKYEFEKIDSKQSSLDEKASKEFGNLQRQIEALTVSSRQRDNVDFSKYSDKELPVDLSEIHSLVEMALVQYDADKIGIPDYALESAGGRIHVPYHSQTHSSGWPIMKVFGMVVWEDTRTPREIIKPETLPGNCWPLKGSSGYAAIKLAFPIIPTMVTMEHLHPALSKFHEDALQSTPKNFSVFGWLDEQGKDKVLLGSYTYVQLSKARQTFPIQVLPDEALDIVELNIESNYGNPVYTCIYRFRVHGNPVQSNDSDEKTA
ncbi:SUN domain-containing protein 2-like [Rhopilema esculentum]|uniref:SUN domain-containing protein 2-like n=1 Tax=Rhopilema esculentum TaxID=499914 RepID=UPI0031D62545